MTEEKLKLIHKRINNWIESINIFRETTKNMNNKNCLTCKFREDGLKELNLEGVGGLKDIPCQDCSRLPIGIIDHMLKQDRFEISVNNEPKDKLYSYAMMYQFNEFSKELGFKHWLSQYIYLENLFRNGYFRAYDRGTGKTKLAMYLVAFNEKYKLWKINYYTETIMDGREIKQSIREITEEKLTECTFIHPKDKLVPESTMTIIDGHTLSISIEHKRTEYR